MTKEGWGAGICSMGVLFAALLLGPPSVAAEQSRPQVRPSTAASVDLPQGSITLPPFALPPRGRCGEVPVEFSISGKDRMRIEVDITTPDGALVASLIVGRAAVQRDPQIPIQVCRKAMDEDGLVTAAIRPDTAYRLTVTTQVGGRHGPESVYTDGFRTGR